MRNNSKWRQLRLLTAAVAVVAAVSGLTAPAVAGDLDRCSGNMERVYKLKASDGTSYVRARWAAHRYDRKIMGSGKWPSSTIMSRGYECKANKVGYETYRVRCTRGESTIKFLWGV